MSEVAVQTTSMGILPMAMKTYGDIIRSGGNVLRDKAIKCGLEPGEVRLMPTYVGSDDCIDVADIDGTMVGYRKILESGLRGIAAKLLVNSDYKIPVEDCLVEGMHMGDPETTMTVSSRQSADEVWGWQNRKNWTLKNIGMVLPWVHLAGGFDPSAVTKLGIPEENIFHIGNRGCQQNAETDIFLAQLEGKIVSSGKQKVVFHADVGNLETIKRDVKRVLTGHDKCAGHDIDFAAQVKEVCQKHSVEFEFRMINPNF